MNSQNPKKKFTVLIVEDDIDLSNMYSEKFNLEGFNVLVASNGEAGLELAKEKRPDVILLDIQLPKEPGLSLLNKLRDEPEGKEMLVIALTNYADKDKKIEALRLGAKEFLIKAMQTPEDVVEKVKKHLSPKSAPHSNPSQKE